MVGQVRAPDQGARGLQIVAANAQPRAAAQAELEPAPTRPLERGDAGGVDDPGAVDADEAVRREPGRDRGERAALEREPVYLDKRLKEIVRETFEATNVFERGAATAE